LGEDQALQLLAGVQYGKERWISVEKRELYFSSNGDRWFLCRDPAAGNAFIRHKANLAPDGQLTDLGIGAFLS